MKTLKEVIDKIQNAVDRLNAGINDDDTHTLLGQAKKSLESLDNDIHESEIDQALDTLMILRGEHKSRVRNPVYGEERQLAKDLLKHFIISLNNNIPDGKVSKEAVWNALKNNSASPDDPTANHSYNEWLRKKLDEIFKA